MAPKNKIHDGEKALIDMGCYVASPINLCVLLTPNEQVVLNVIRHSKNLGQRFISNSALQVSTGLSENTVRKVRDALLQLDIIEQVGETTSAGLEYKINHKVLCTIIEELNNTKNPIERLVLADRFRGEKLARHTAIIKKYRDSELDRKFNN